MSTLSNYVKRGGFFKAVVEDGSDIIFIVDYQGKILYHNRSVEDVLGYAPSSLVGEFFFDYILPSTLPKFRKIFLATTKKEFSESIEFQFKRKDDTFHYLEFNSINLFQKEKIKGLILDCRDIEQRKKDAAELLRAQKAKELFLANISHEIRTPINGIAGMASLLSQNPSANEQATYLRAIQSAANNLKVIINDILDLASIESGKLKFEYIGFNLNDLLQSLINTFSFQVSEKGILLHYDLQTDANLILMGDPVRLNQILLNLIGNAIKFTQHGSITLSCHVQKKTNKNHLIVFEVKDTGIGIPEIKLNTIFESFSQADASVTRKYGGTGLGLTIAKQLVDLQKGTISVTSKEGIGSVFTVTIPYPIANKNELSRQPNTVDTYHKKSLPHLSVLVVEDNDINRLYCSRILKIWNCKIDSAENGLVAIEKIKHKTYDVVLMDVQMPVMDGLDATHVIRNSLSPKNKIPIIALTADASRKNIEACLAIGMNDCIVKPFTPEDLYEKLARIKTSREPKIHQNRNRVDLTYLENSLNNDKKFVQEIVMAFLKSIPEFISEIKHNIAQGDRDTLLKITHKIKPSITMMGMKGTHEKITHIEELSKLNNNTLLLHTLTNELCADLSDAMNELREIVNWN